MVKKEQKLEVITLRPDQIQSPIGVLPFCGALGVSEWEELAAFIVIKSQNAGKWVAFEDGDSDMISAGYFQSTLEGYMLTNNAVEILYKQYPAD